MATEKGVVTKVGPATAWVKTTKTSACESCTARDSCHTLGGGNEAEIEVINTAGAKEGDNVVIRFETSSLLKATFLLYVFPIILLVIGAVIGQQAAPYLNFNPSGFSAVIGFSFFFAAVLTIKFKANRLARKNEYRPKIIKVLS